MEPHEFTIVEYMPVSNTAICLPSAVRDAISKKNKRTSLLTMLILSSMNYKGFWKLVQIAQQKYSLCDQSLAKRINLKWMYEMFLFDHMIYVPYTELLAFVFIP